MWPNQKMLLIDIVWKIEVSENLTGSSPQGLQEKFLAEVVQQIWPLKCSRRKAWPLLDLLCKAVFNINGDLVVVFALLLTF